MGRRRGRSRCGLKIESRGTHDLVYPRNHVRGNENKSVVTGQPCVIFSRRNDRPPPPSAPPSSISLIRGNSIRPSRLYGLEEEGRGLEGNTMASGRIYSCHWKRGSKEEGEDDAFIGTEA